MMLRSLRPSKINAPLVPTGIPDRSLAEKMASRWEKNAGDIYMYLMNKLGEDQ